MEDTKTTLKIGTIHDLIRIGELRQRLRSVDQWKSMSILGLFLSVPAFILAIIGNRSGSNDPSFNVLFSMSFLGIIGCGLTLWLKSKEETDFRSQLDCFMSILEIPQDWERLSASGCDTIQVLEKN